MHSSDPCSSRTLSRGAVVSALLLASSSPWPRGSTRHKAELILLPTPSSPGTPADERLQLVSSLYATPPRPLELGSPRWVLRLGETVSSLPFILPRGLSGAACGTGRGGPPATPTGLAWHGACSPGSSSSTGVIIAFDRCRLNAAFSLTVLWRERTDKTMSAIGLVDRRLCHPASTALSLLARADSQAYSKMALLSKHLPMDEIVTPRRARFAGLLFLINGEHKEGGSVRGRSKQSKNLRCYSVAGGESGLGWLAPRFGCLRGRRHPKSGVKSSVLALTCVGIDGRTREGDFYCG